MTGDRNAIAVPSQCRSDRPWAFGDAPVMRPVMRWELFQDVVPVLEVKIGGKMVKMVLVSAVIPITWG